MSKGTVFAVMGGVAALAAVAFFWSSDSESLDDGDIRVSRRRAQDDQGRDAGAPRERRAASRDASESRGDSARTDDRTARDDGGTARRRLPPAIGGGHSDARPRGDSAQGAGQMNGARRERGAGIARPPVNRAEGGERDRPDLPKATDRDPAQDVEADVVEPPAEPIREVAFDGGDRLFDTGVPMEVTDAGRISPDGGTVSFWIQPEWANNKEDSADLMKLGETGLQILKEGSFLRFEHVDANGNEQGGDADIGQWQDGEWHQVIASWTSGSMTFFVDGGQVFANQGPRSPAQSDPRLFVGSVFPEGTGIALARMSQLTVINRTASVEEVKKIFEAGSPIRK